MYCRVLNWMSTDVSVVRAASIIALILEAARTSETSVDIQLRTRQYILEDSELHTRRRENLKSHKIFDAEWKGIQTLKNVLKYYKLFLPYKNHQLQHSEFQEVLPNLRKQISLLSLLSILKLSTLDMGSVLSWLQCTERNFMNQILGKLKKDSCTDNP
jgi:hypothetical protein